MNTTKNSHSDPKQKVKTLDNVTYTNSIFTCGFRFHLLGRKALYLERDVILFMQTLNIIITCHGLNRMCSRSKSGKGFDIAEEFLSQHSIKFNK